MELTFKIKPDNGDPYTVTSDSRDVIEWEKGHPSRSLASFQANQRLTDLSAIACFAATRKGFFHGPPDTFAATTAIQVVPQSPDDIAMLDPTQPGR